MPRRWLRRRTCGVAHHPPHGHDRRQRLPDAPLLVLPRARRPLPLPAQGRSHLPARIGDNRYHSIFGDDNGCFAVSLTTRRPALVALGATVVTTKREVPAEEFFGAHGHRSNVLEDGEVVKEFRVPKAEKSAFQKFALRKSIDFPVVNCAVAATGGETRVVLGGRAPGLLGARRRPRRPWQRA